MIDCEQLQWEVTFCLTMGHHLFRLRKPRTAPHSGIFGGRGQRLWLCPELSLLCHIISNDKIQMTNQIQMYKCPNPQSSEESMVKRLKVNK